MANNIDTIAAIATPPGRGAVGIVRLSGPDANWITKQLIRSLPAPRAASLRTITDNDGTQIDKAIILRFPAPNSYTGEDMFEFQTHGGPVTTKDVLAALVTAGARYANPGEFSERAFLNGRMDLLQAEAVADLIATNSSRAARLALRSLAGGFSASVNNLTSVLHKIRVQLEAYIDFPEEEIPEPEIDSLSSMTIEVSQKISDVIHQARQGARFNTGIDVAIVGRPNVGKSTLLNALSNSETAIVSEEPGTTRDILSSEVQISGLPVRLFDTAGLRETGNVVEKEGIRRAKEKLRDADAVFYVTDSGEPPPDIVAETDGPLFIIRNKIDLENTEPSVNKRSSAIHVHLSALHNMGLEGLKNALLSEFDLTDVTENTLLARERHIDRLIRAHAALEFDYSILYRRSPELGAEHLRQASIELQHLTGEYSNEDLLGDIFSTFCIGK